MKSFFRLLPAGMRGRKAPWSWPWLGAVVAFAAMDHLVYVDPPAPKPSAYSLDFFMASSVAGEAQVFYDVGRGFNGRDFTQLPVTASADLSPYRFSIPAGKVRRLRIDFLMGPGQVSIHNARLVGAIGNEIRKIRAEEFVPNDQVSRCTPDADGVTAVAPDGVNDPGLFITFTQPVHLPVQLGIALMRDPKWRAATIVLVLVLVGAAIHAIIRWLPTWAVVAIATVQRWRDAWPRRCLFAVAALGTVCACHPVVFLGRSFVSPNIGSLLLYNGAPTVPGLKSVEFEDVQGADVGAMMWAHLPYSHIEHRALFTDGELPLWNRFSSAGVPLLGQGQSMLGDPVHWLVILAGGSAWAWDLKFLLARVLFCAGAGWIAYAVTRHFPTAALMAFAAAFIGFFNYRINHPAIFAVCYAPWILVAWLGVLQNRERPRALTGWLAGLLLASIATYGSGTVKEATMLTVCLNATGFLMVLVAVMDSAVKRRLILIVVGTGAAGLLLGAPLWLVFLQTLRDGATFSDAPSVITLPWRAIVGVFDGIFLQESFDARSVFAPSSNFLILFGVAILLVRITRHWRDRVAMPGLLMAAGALALAYGVVPQSWILATPVLRQISHVHNTFSCVAIVLLLIPAAVGLSSLARSRAGRLRGWEVAALAGSILLLIVLFFSVDPPRWQGGENGLLGTFHHHGYFLRAVALLLAGWGLLVAVCNWRSVTVGRACTPVLALLTITALLPLLGRHGHRVESGHDDYFFRPMPRPDFSVPSPAMEWIKSQSADPVRVVGLNYNLLPGFTAVVGVEGVNGPDAVMSPAYRELAIATGLADPRDWYYPSNPVSMSRARPMLDLLNAGFYMNNRGQPVPGGLEATVELDLAIYRSPTAWPRAFFVDAAFAADSAEATAAFLRAGDQRPFAALGSAEPVQRLLPAIPAGARTVTPARNYRLTANSTRFEVEATGPGIVVLTETWWPEAFRASLNGNPEPVLRVNHAFKGVAVPAAGTYYVQFRYAPRHFQLSLALALVGLVGFGLLVWKILHAPSTAKVSSVVTAR